MYGVVGDSAVPGGEPGEAGDEGEVGWNVGLWEGACSGFLGKSEMGGEWSTSFCHVSYETRLVCVQLETYPANTILQKTMQYMVPAKYRVPHEPSQEVFQESFAPRNGRRVLLGL